MNGEINLGKINRISITKMESDIDGRNDYDMTFQTDNGRFHLIMINELPYHLLRAVSNIEDWDEKRPSIKQAEDDDLPF